MIGVRKIGLDWITVCVQHGEVCSAGDWEGAMEMAYGHRAMHHGDSKRLERIKKIERILASAEE